MPGESPIGLHEAFGERLQAEVLAHVREAGGGDARAVLGRVRQREQCRGERLVIAGWNEQRVS